MTDYNFHTLNDKDFELLVRDLLQKEYEITLEDFKSGKDQGIDLRYSKSNEDKVIVQCKHWLKSGVSNLKSHLRNSEKEKVIELDPDRYIFATSLGLSPSDKKDIKEILSPFILNDSDIVSRQSLNNLLSKFPEIEENHYKLWISSTSILKKITSEYIRERSKLYAEEIHEKIKLFVPTASFKIAEQILSDHSILMITGEPGIGKTMLANFLVFNHLKEDYELTYIHKDLSDAEEVFDKKKKQIFYFDDFLGSNYLEILSEKNFDSQLYHLIKVIKRSENHKLILTSRTTIYNVARLNSEILDDEAFNMLNYQLEISDYDYRDRANILYNHLFFSHLADQYINSITDNEFYFEIIKHPNFNPRIIEFITDETKVELTKPEDYSNFILDALDNPEKIWSKAFHKQISEIDRIFLLTLFSFDLPVEEERFKEAFDKRLSYEVENSGFTVPINYYNKSLDTLLGGFIKRYDRNPKPYKIFLLEFLNPSITDFFINYLKERKSEAKRIVQSAKHYEQINYRFISPQSDLNKLFQFDEIQNEIIESLSSSSGKSIARDLNLLIKSYSYDTIEPYLKELIQLLLKKGYYGNSDSLKLIYTSYQSPEVKDLIDSKIDDFLSYLLHSIEDLDDISLFVDFLKMVEIDDQEYLDEYGPDIIAQLHFYVQQRLQNIDLFEIEIDTYYHPEDYYYVESIIEQIRKEVQVEIENINEELREIGIHYNLTDSLKLSDIEPDYRDMADRYEQDMVAAHTEPGGYRSTGISSLKPSDQTYIRDLFS